MKQPPYNKKIGTSINSIQPSHCVKSFFKIVVLILAIIFTLDAAYMTSLALVHSAAIRGSIRPTDEFMQGCYAPYSVISKVPLLNRMNGWIFAFWLKVTDPHRTRKNP